MPERHQYVSRAGEKLAAALRACGVDPTGWTAVDFGSHVGGFVDCLLKQGAGRVYAVEPGHGVLDAKLRSDGRVVVCEGTNALRYQCPEPVRLITIDVGWTPQRLILPAARRNLAGGGDVITLIKPHYEAPQAWLRQGILPDERHDAVLSTVREDVAELGWQIAGEVISPLAGHGGNREYLWHLRRE